MSTERDAAVSKVVRAARIYRDSTVNIRYDQADDPDGEIREDWKRLDVAIRDLDDVASAPALAAVPEKREPKVGDVWIVTDGAQGGRVSNEGREVRIRSADQPRIIYDYVAIKAWGDIPREDFHAEFTFVRTPGEETTK